MGLKAGKKVLVLLLCVIMGAACMASLPGCSEVEALDMEWVDYDTPLKGEIEFGDGDMDGQLIVAYASFTRGEIASSDGMLDGVRCFFVNVSGREIHGYAFRCITFDDEGRPIEDISEIGYAYLPYEGIGNSLEFGPDGGELELDLDGWDDEYTYIAIQPDAMVCETVAIWDQSRTVVAVHVIVTSVTFTDGSVLALTSEDVSRLVEEARPVEYADEEHVAFIRQRALQSNTGLVSITLDKSNREVVMANNSGKEVQTAYVVLFPGGGDYLYTQPRSDAGNWLMEVVMEMRIKYVAFTDGTFWFNPYIDDYSILYYDIEGNEPYDYFA